jgi:hypothetical protein
MTFYAESNLLPMASAWILYVTPAMAIFSCLFFLLLGTLLLPSPPTHKQTMLPNLVPNSPEAKRCMCKLFMVSLALSQSLFSWSVSLSLALTLPLLVSPETFHIECLSWYCTHLPSLGYSSPLSPLPLLYMSQAILQYCMRPLRRW